MTKQLFKGETLSRTVVKNNILRIWNLTDESERYDWYQDAHDFAYDLFINHGASSQTPCKFGIITTSKTCGIIAALSPLKTWDQNKKCAIQMLETGDCGHMQSFKDKAYRIINSNGTDESILKILNGRKISSFYLNIRYPHKAEYVTIDRHALSIALGRWVTEDDYKGMTANQYEFFMQCYVLAAMKVNVSPLLMQSATWVKWRKIKKDY